LALLWRRCPGGARRAVGAGLMWDSPLTRPRRPEAGEPRARALRVPAGALTYAANLWDGTLGEKPVLAQAVRPPPCERGRTPTGYPVGRSGPATRRSYLTCGRQYLIHSSHCRTHPLDGYPGRQRGRHTEMSLTSSARRALGLRGVPAGAADLSHELRGRGTRTPPRRRRRGDRRRLPGGRRNDGRCLRHVPSCR
jgi:hypothetical protein